MALTSGTRLGPYEIVSAIGAGGMGEVYRARDARLGRDVAIKVLPSNVTTDEERLRRFEQEARAVASLNHPNILAVYDIGHADATEGGRQGAPYIVSELLDGETLRSRLASGPRTAPRKAVDYAVQIARGLAAAHEKHLVHRDLKPDNVFITADNRVKILDFGLAKLVGQEVGHDPGEPGSIMTALPTTPPQTALGIVLGTVGYMAPEQVRGLPTDHRADIFALGAVLYEMLAGRRAFDGNTTADVMTAILKEDPPELPADLRLTAPALSRIVDRCLAKQPGARFTSADDLAFALESLSSASTSSAQTVVEPERPGPRRWVAIATGAALGSMLTAAIALPILRQRQPVDDRPVVRLQLTLPDDVIPARGQPPAVSPDSTRIAMVAVDQASGTRFIYLRALNSGSAQSVRGTERAIYPFWSADGAKIAFFADGRLKALDLANGNVQDVCAVPNPNGPGIWVDDTIVYPRSVGAVLRVSASGGTPVAATPFDAEKEQTQTVVGFLADRRRFVFGTSGSTTLRIGSTDALAGEPLDAVAFRGWLHAPWLNTAGAVGGHLLFLRGSALFAVGINGVTAQITGEPEPLAQALSSISSGAANPFSVQDTVLAYVSSTNSASRLVWVNRQGQTLGPVGTLSGFLRDVRLSPDGSLVTVSRYNDADRAYNLMLVDVRRMTSSQLTYGSSAYGASWLPDQSGIAFTVGSPKGAVLMQMASREGAAPEPVQPPGSVGAYLPDASRGGRSVVYTRTTPDGDGDLFLQSLEKPSEGQAFLATPAVETGPRFSPDGAWIAYQSNESGIPEVFIRSFPSGGDKQQVSRRGGYRPVWRRDGKELFYLSYDGDLMAAAISLKPTVVVGLPEKLFRTPIDPGGAIAFYQFDAHPDNQRFIMAVPVTDAPQPVNVILNWQSMLKQ